MSVYPCDLELSEAVDSFDGRALGDESEVSAIVREKVWPFVLSQTRAGKQLKENYAMTNGLMSRVGTEFARRFGLTGEIRPGLQNPGVYFASRIEQVIGDLIATRDPSLELLVDIERPTAHVQTEDERFTALVEQVGADINNRTMSSETIRQKRQASRDYDRAFTQAMSPAASAAKPTAPSEVVQFSHMLNDEIQTRGVPRPSAGFYTIHAGGKEYKYDIARFQELSDAAVKFELVQ
jgi:hypothetical protein